MEATTERVHDILMHLNNNSLDFLKFACVAKTL